MAQSLNDKPEVTEARNQEAADFVVFRFGPDDGDVGERAAGDPHFFAVQNVLMALFHGAGEHAAGIRAELWLSEAEAADGLAGLQARQPFFFLRVAPEGVDRIHHQRALDGDEAAQAGIAAFEFLSHQAVGDVRHSRAAVTVKIGAEEAEFAEQRDKVLGESSFAVVLLDDGDDFVVDELAGSLADKFFFVVKLGIKVDEVNTGKRGHERFLRQAKGATQEV
jgi:hypothetical protein